MLRYLSIHKRTKTPPPTQKEEPKQFFDENGHLNDSGITLYVEALALKKTHALPKDVLKHASACPSCQSEILDFYQFMKEDDWSEDLAQSHPFFKPSPAHLILRKAWDYTSSLGRVAAVILLTVVSCLAYLIVSDPDPINFQSVRSPFENQAINVPFHTWKVQANHALTLRLDNDSYLEIPASCFVTEEGAEVKGEIELRYREFHQASDIISGGIPTSYQHGNQSQTLETAGMFELRAYQGEEVLQIAPNKYIEVHLVTENQDKDFNNYYLDESDYGFALSASLLASPAQAQTYEPHWQYLGKSILIQTQSSKRSGKIRWKKTVKRADSLRQVIMKAHQRETLLNTTEQGIKKGIPARQTRYFTLSLNAEENPALLKYQDKVWKYMGENEEESPTYNNHWVLNEEWDSLSLYPLRYKPLSLRGHIGPVNTASFSQDGQYIVTASDDHTTKVWTQEAQYLHTLVGHRGAVNSAVFSPDRENTYILTASDDHTARIWSKEGDHITTLNGHHGPVKSAVFSTEGDFILTASLDNTARLWNARGQILHTFPHRTHICSPQISPDGKYLLTLNDDGSAQLWTTEGESITRLKGKFNSLAFSPNSRQIMTTSYHASVGAVALWSIKGDQLKRFDLNDASAAFTPDGSHMLSTTGNSSRLWYVNPAESYNAVLIRNMQPDPKKERKGHEAPITSVNFSADGEYIITASEDQTARIWSQNGWLLHTLREHTQPINSAVFSPDGEQILTSSEDHTAKIWIKRELNDVYEMELIKAPRVYKDKQAGRVRVEGKKFYTVVRTVQPKESPAEIRTPQLENNPLHELVEKYEELLVEKEILEKAKTSSKPLTVRKFRVKKLGIYGSHRVYQNPYALDCQVDVRLAPRLDFEAIDLFHISGNDRLAITKYHYESGDILSIPMNPEADNELIAILPGDKIARLSVKEFSEIKSQITPQSLRNTFTLKVWDRVDSKKEFDKLLHL